jgi:predicted SAM-dependent methyltransferase
MIPFNAQHKVLELGGGAQPRFRPNLDMRTLPTVDIVADLCAAFPVPDNEFDGVYSSYVIEHISWRKVRSFVEEIYRVLKPGGTAFLITANLLEQCKLLARTPDWDDKLVCAIFGDQNYEGENWRANAHYCGFSPQFVTQIFMRAGFNDVFILPHPNCKTDMIIEAKKREVIQVNPADNWNTNQRKAAYNREYFDGGKGKVGGYAHEGYWDFPIHWLTAAKILEYKPTSVLEIGAARGYVLKKIEDTGIRVAGLEVSDHCLHTRVIKDIRQWDITQKPWPFPDASFDLCISMAVMEHIPADKVKVVIEEIERVCTRAVHGISFEDDNFDKTHVTLRPISWWRDILPATQTVVDKEDFEHGPVPIPKGDGKIKLNIGSFTTMFHHGWINMDIHAGLVQWANAYGYNFRQHDMRTPLPFPNNSVDMIYAHHFLEHINYEEGSRFMAECARVMKPGGLIRLIMPDAPKLIQMYTDNTIGQFDEINDGCAKTPYAIAKLWALLFSGHNSMYDLKTLQSELSKHFSGVKNSGFRESYSPQMLTETLDLLPTLSLFVEAIK